MELLLSFSSNECILLTLCNASLFRQACQKCTNKQSNMTEVLSFRPSNYNVF
uniref:Predicted protein n=1 Tax=Hordeum vulgare subsp. vulgare TaxID=112509 RepID=F2CZU7_HORVV|nr:predicted protein [Hordeum vulgare subsp. vulgare]